ncbi:hypothetical protein [Nocardia gamkensis]|uniref:hypothetical protein n=1 Tax=Nocardia gamkensis TaxID=352869 RepID=UPI0007A370FD|nr:hypothetical protein [Nocardia gamkensis]
MLAGRLFPRAADGQRFRLEEVPEPTPGPGQVLIEVAGAGVCLSDVHLIDFAESVSAVLPLAEADKAVQALENKEGNPI